MPFVTPNDFHFKTAFNKNSMTAKGSEIFSVTPEQFTNWRWQMKHQVQEANDLFQLPLIAQKLTTDEKTAFEALKDKFHAGISPYSLSVMNFDDPLDPVRIQLMPSAQELYDRDGVADPLKEVTNSPVKEVVHVYKDRVAFCVAQLCPVYCRYCFRKRRDGEEGLHFNPNIVARGIEYIASQPQIRDVLITGGDPLIAQDGTLRNLLSQLRAIPHVEIIRIGTRVPVSLPYRITTELADMLAEFHPFWINTHFNSAQEITPEATSAIDTLLRRGIPVGNQSVFLNKVNDSAEKMKELLEALIRVRVRPYYIYHPQIVEGTEHLRIPVEKGLDIMRELRGNTTGFAIPQYVLDTPTGKVPLSPNHVLGRDGDDVLIEQLNKRAWAEPSPLNSYIPQRALENLSLNNVDRV